MKRLLLICLLLAVPAASQATAGFSKIGNVTTTTFTDTACPNLSTCGYQLTAVDSSGFESTPALCATAQLCMSGNIVVVTMPSSGTHTVTLQWGASATTGVSYNVYRHIGPLPPTAASGTVN